MSNNPDIEPDYSDWWRITGERNPPCGELLEQNKALYAQVRMLELQLKALTELVVPIMPPTPIVINLGSMSEADKASFLAHWTNKVNTDG